MARSQVRLFVIAGEHSGDALGGKLMAAINARRKGSVRYLGVGGDAMEAQGLVSQFPLDDVAVMGPLAILKRLPRILRRVYQTVDAVIASEPDALVIIDSPEFTHPIAKRVRRRAPGIPIIDYVSPSVWAWRPGRARKMRPYVDHLLALLPFEPEAHRALGGPACTYVGHPLIERLDWIRGLDAAELAGRFGLTPGRPVLVVLPGSRSSEVARLMRPFGEAVRILCAGPNPPEVLLPVVSASRGTVEEALAHWPLRPHLVEGEEDRFKAFRLADAALAASGTVTLELALAGTPMAVAYVVDPVAAPFLRRLITANTIVLANLVLGRNAFPELIQERCTGALLAETLAPLLADTPERQAQLQALREVPDRMAIAQSPSAAAAEIVLALAERGRVPDRPA
ncbi:MAG: lipid-A-disaccharide synthase [Hyphomicrobiaceae bacterium]